MKLIRWLACITFSLNFLTATAQDYEGPHINIKWVPSALLIGSVNLQAEYNIDGKHSLTANIGLPSKAKRTLTYQGNDADFDMRATSFLAGYRVYLSDRHMSGAYVEPYYKYLHHSSEGVGYGYLDYRSVTFNFTNEYNAMGLGAELGYQFLIGDRAVIDIYLVGPEFNYASNNLRAVEMTGTRPWTVREAIQAEVEIRRFINQIPFIRKNTTVMVDKDSRSILAQFKGPLPGYRAGISFGIAF